MKSFKSYLKEEFQEFLYHGSTIGAIVGIQRSGKMKLNAANNNEPFISFTSDLKVAKSYADRKGGFDPHSRGIILRTLKTNSFSLSDKFKNNTGYEWVTKEEIPIEKLEIKRNNEWYPLNDWDIIDDKLSSSILETYYHITPTKNVKSILKNGLIPKIGSRSKKIKESENLVYLFKSKEDVENAITNWLGDEFPEDESLTVLKITFPKDSVKIDHDSNQFEYTTREKINSKYISTESEIEV